MPDWMTYEAAVGRTGGPVSVGSVFFISASSGSDTTGDGSQGNPWRTFISNLSGKYVMQPGDTVKFARDDVWVGRDANVSIASSGSQLKPITITVYGSGKMPTLIGDSTTTVGWTATGISSIYLLTTSQTQTVRVVSQQDTYGLCVWRGTTANLPEGTWVQTNGVLYVRLYGNSDPSVSTVRVGSFLPIGGVLGGLLAVRSNATNVMINSMRVIEVNGVGIYAGASNNQFFDCHLVGAGRDGVVADAFLSGFTHALGFRWWRGDVGWNACAGGGNGQGMTIYASSSWVIGANVHDNYMAGIDFLDFGTDQNLSHSGCAWCTVKHNGRWQDATQSFDPGIYVDGGHHIYIYGNIVSESGSGPTTQLSAKAGIQWGSEHADTDPCHDIYIINNLLYNNYWVGLNPNNAQAVTSNILNTWIVNNTVISALNMNSSNQIYLNGEIHPQSGNYIIKNNVFYMGAANQEANLFVTTDNLLDSDYNVYFRDGSTNIYSQNGGTTNYTLGSWQGVTNRDLNSIYSDPLLVNVSNGSTIDVHVRTSSSPILARGATNVFTVPSWLPTDVFTYGGAVRGSTNTNGTFDNNVSSIDCGYHYLSDQPAT